MSSRSSTPDFARLTIGGDEQDEEGMPAITRSQTASTRRISSSRHGQISSSRRSQQMSSEGGLSRPMPAGATSSESSSSDRARRNAVQVSDRTHIRYDNTAFDVRTRAMANAAFQSNDLEMIRFSEEDEPASGYRFEMSERIVLTVPDPDFASGIPACTCSPIHLSWPCKHLWWLLDQVLFGASTAGTRQNEHIKISSTGATASLTRNDITQPSHSIYSMLENKLDDIARRFAWVEYDAEEERFRHGETLGLFSTLDQGLLPFEFAGLDLTDDSQALQSTLFRRYVDTVLIEASRDTRIHQQINNLLGLYYDNVIWEKLNTRIKDVFHDFDLMTNGHNVDFNDVPGCAARLWDISASIGGLMRNIPGNLQPSRGLRLALAGLLLEMVEGVVQRQGNAYGNFRPAFVEPAARQDIFLLMIVEQPPPGRPIFVLPVLERVLERLSRPLDAVLSDRITDIVGILAQTSAPRDYVRRLRSIE